MRCAEIADDGFVGIVMVILEPGEIVVIDGQPIMGGHLLQGQCRLLFRVIDGRLCQALRRDFIRVRVNKKPPADVFLRAQIIMVL